MQLRYCIPAQNNGDACFEHLPSSTPLYLSWRDQTCSEQGKLDLHTGILVRVKLDVNCQIPVFQAGLWLDRGITQLHPFHKLKKGEGEGAGGVLHHRDIMLPWTRDKKTKHEIKQIIVDLKVTFPLKGSVFGRCQSVESIEAQHFVTFAGFTVAIAIVSCMGSACGTVVHLTHCSCRNSPEGFI